MFIIYWPITNRLWISDECEPYYPTAFPSECVWLVPGTNTDRRISNVQLIVTCIKCGNDCEASPSKLCPSCEMGEPPIYQPINDDRTTPYTPKPGSI